MLSFIQVPSHKGETITQELVNYFNEWGISKIQTVTMDNASANDSVIEKLKRKLKEKNGTLVLEVKFCTIDVFVISLI